MDEKEQSVWMEDKDLRQTAGWKGDTCTSSGNLAQTGSEWKTGAGNSEQPCMQSGQESPGNGTVLQGNFRTETEETKRLKENYGTIAPMALLYGVFYTFCMYRNSSGITFPLFAAGSILLVLFVLDKVGVPGRDFSRKEKSRITLKKNSWFYITAILLLGISTFCTDDKIIIFFNKLGAFLLMMSLLLKQFFDTSKWKTGKFLGSICIMLGASFGELDRPFTDRTAYNKSRDKKSGKKVWYAALGLLIGLPVLLVMILLLASADVVFRQMTARLLKSISLAGIFSMIFRTALGFFGVYALTAYLCKRRIREDVGDNRKGEPVLAITVTGLLTVLYLIFSVIQIVGLFMGKLRLPEGYTYAVYARQGFFQLLVVSLLNLVIVLCCLAFFRESRVLKAVLALMSACTFIMIASSFMRMMMYIRYYYLTYLRILVLWALVVLALVFAGVLVHIFRECFPLFRYSMAVVTVLYLVLSFAHPDYVIARVNVANAPHGEMLLHEEGTEWTQEELSDFFLAKEPYQDYAYLRTLCADAAPVLVPYLKELGYCMEAFYEEDAVEYVQNLHLPGGSVNSRSDQEGFGYYWMRKLQRATDNFGIRTYNVSRHRALAAFAGEEQ